MEGNYQFGRQHEGRYQLSIRAMGYKTVCDTVVLRKSSVGRATEVVKDYVLSDDVKQIGAVVVTANNTARYFDRTIYTVTNEDRKTAVTSLDLTAKIAQIRIDHQTDKILSADGNVTVLVNGVASTERELKAIRPEEVRKMEYYDLPPIKYGLNNNNKVINIITKNREDGIYGGVELTHHLTSPWLNDSFYLHYNRGRHQLTFNALVSYNLWDNQYTSDEMEYTLSDTNFRQTEEARSRNKTFRTELSLKYTINFRINMFFRRSFTRVSATPLDQRTLGLPFSRTASDRIVTE